MPARKLLSFVFSVLFPFLIGGPLATVRGNEVIPRSQLRGRVVDPNRAAIAGAKITALRRGALASFALTNADGEFSLTLEPGEYTLEISAEGFAESVVSVRSQPTSFEPLEILMQLAGYSAIVTV